MRGTWGNKRQEFNIYKIRYSVPLTCNRVRIAEYDGRGRRRQACFAVTLSDTRHVVIFYYLFTCGLQLSPTPPAGLMVSACGNMAEIRVIIHSRERPPGFTRIAGWQPTSTKERLRGARGGLRARPPCVRRCKSEAQRIDARGSVFLLGIDLEAPRRAELDSSASNNSSHVLQKETSAAAEGRHAGSVAEEAQNKKSDVGSLMATLSK